MSSRSTPLGGTPAISASAIELRPAAGGGAGDGGAVLRDPTRLAALEATGLLSADGGRDAGPQSVLARVARLAALALDAPVAQVNLVTAEEQIPRAVYVDPAVTTDDPRAWREPVGLAASLCQYLVATGEPRLIEDARTDPLVVPRHAAVLDAGLVGYCAVPLRAPAPPGSAPGAAQPVIGSVCVVDFAPRRWTSAQVAALEDVASVAAAEIAQRSAEGRTRGVADAMPQIVWTAAPDGRTTFVNQRWTEYTGQDAEAAARDGTSAFLHPDDAAPVAAAWARRLPGGDEAGADFAFEYRLRGRDGQYRWHLGRVVAERDALDRVTRWIGTGTDVDERRRTEQALADANLLLQEQAVELEVSNQHLQEQAVEVELRAAALAAGDARYRSLLSSLDTGFCVLEVLFDAAGLPNDYRFLETNAEFVRQVGFGDPVGRRIREIAPGIEPFWYETYGRVARTGEPVRFAHAAAALGRAYDVFAYRVDAPELRRVAVLFRDVTAERNAAAERERLLVESEAARAAAELARADAEAANLAKAQFLANMSHELRTPLNAIGGYAQLLELGLHGPVTPDQQHALGRVQAAQRHLLGLINDILNYAKLESGRVEYDVRALDVRDVLREVWPLVEPQMAVKGLAYEVRVPDDAAAAPFVVWADREKLAQILVNLLSNATKFTSARHPVTGARGRVTVDVAVRRGAPADVADEGVVFVRVADTGRGIPRDQQERVFEPFVQVRAGYAQATEGTGLGLAISRDLARGMGGNLRVRSVVGEGSTFTVTLRAAAGEVAPRERRAGDALEAGDDRVTGA